MSHAVVLVIGDDIDGQMAAYDENKTVEPYKDYAGTPDPERWPWSPALEQCPGLDITDHAAVITAWAERYPEEERYEFDENGLYSWSTYNPESKWDWYEVGGRWAGSLLVKPLVAANAPNVRVNEFSEEIAAQEREHFAPVMDGRHTDQATKGQIDWEGMRLERLSRLDERWEGYLRRLSERGEDEAKRAAYWEFGLDLDDLARGREAHLAHEATLNPLHWVQAALGEGVWREKGRMGWFGMSSDGPEEREQWDEWLSRFIAAMPDDTLLSVVDAEAEWTVEALGEFLWPDGPEPAE